LKPHAKISIDDARQIILSRQGLLENSFGKGKSGTLNAIEHLGYVQIDTISVVERAHHHTIWSRVNDYKPAYLNQLVEKDKAVFEYWSHAAAYLPMRDFRFSLIRKHRFLSGQVKRYTNKKIIQYVYDRIVAEGPLQSKDFEAKKPRGGWWEWKDTKLALEQLFSEGRLMAAGRKGFQKVYDLTERVLPEWVDTSMPTAKEYAEYLVKKAIRSSGIVAAEEIGYMRSHAKTPVAKLLVEKLQEGILIPVEIKGIDKQRYYTTPENLGTAPLAKSKNQVKILSPFDNIVIQRRRLKRIFDFDYTIECYLPEAKRVYGYFCLPVLVNNGFIGRIDCKADRASKELIVKKTFFEKQFKPTLKSKKQLENALREFALFTGCNKVIMK
jgi:uncharacterized protein YcaQ